MSQRKPPSEPRMFILEDRRGLEELDSRLQISEGLQRLVDPRGLGPDQLMEASGKQSPANPR